MKGFSNLIALLAILFAAASLLGLWVLVVRRFYRVRGQPATLVRTRCKDGWEIGVYYRSAPRRRFREPVLLCHGLAANHFNFDFEPPYSLAHVLSERGFDCFTVDWRGAGASRRAPRGRRWTTYTVDDHIRQDGPALLDLALRTAGATQAFWIGHSLGGLIGLAVAGGERTEQLRGLITIGAPVFFNYDRAVKEAVQIGVTAAWPLRFRHELISAVLAPFLGHFVLPFSDVIVYPRHIPARVQRQLYAQLITSVSRRVLLQFRDWIAHNAFRSFDRKVDYRNNIKRTAVPLLLIGGSRDRLAPPTTVQRAFELAGGPDKILRIFGSEYGDSQEYGHGDLVFGERAPKEVYPLVAEWLAARATELKTGDARSERGAS